MNYFSKNFTRKIWTHPGFQKYLQSISWSLGARILSIAVSVLATAIIARHLGPNNFGELSYAVSFVSIFSFLASLGIDNILYRDLIKYPEKNKELMGSGLTIKLVAGGLAALVCYTSVIFFGKNDLSAILVLILTGTFISNAFQIINYQFQIRVDTKYPAIITFVTTILLNILKILVVVFDKGVIYLALVLLSESILYAVFYLLAYKGKLGGRVSEWKFDKTITISLIRDAWPLMFSTAFALIYSRIDQVLIKHFIDAYSVGIYDAAVRIAEVWYFLPSILVTAFLPAIIHGKTISEELYNARLKRLAGLLLLLSLSIGCIVSIFAPLIIKLIYGSAFFESIPILRIYIWAGVGIFIGTLTANYLITENQKEALLFNSLIPMVSNIVLNLLWIPTYGIVGSAYATLISYILGPLSILLFKENRQRLFSMCFGPKVRKI